MRDKKDISFYLFGLLTVLALKLYTKQADSDELLWILRPTAWWTGILSGHPFTYEQGAGYINHSLRFIIAPACAGLKFWMTASLMLSWSFLHRMKGAKNKLYWSLLCFPAALTVTIFVNGIRITLSIVLPQILQTTGKGISFLTQNQLHTAIGTMVYFLSLLVLYQIGDHLTSKIAGTLNTQKESFLWKRVLPILWYMGPVLCLPFISRIAHGDYKNFSSYELPVLAVCGAILILFSLPLLTKHLIHRRPTAE